MWKRILPCIVSSPPPPLRSAPPSVFTSLASPWRRTCCSMATDMSQKCPKSSTDVGCSLGDDTDVVSWSLYRLQKESRCRITAVITSLHTFCHMTWVSDTTQQAPDSTLMSDNDHRPYNHWATIHAIYIQGNLIIGWTEFSNLCVFHRTCCSTLVEQWLSCYIDQFSKQISCKSFKCAAF